MQKKVFYFDVETTGINWWENEIIQLGYIIEIDGEIKLEKNLKAKPNNWNVISPQALEVTGLSIDILKNYPDQSLMYKELVSDFSKYIDKFNSTDKFYVAGYNVQFDIDFLAEFFKKNKDNYLGSWINWKRLDPLAILHIMDFQNKINLSNYKLETVCKHFNIEIDAHDAFSDIRATRSLLKIFTELSNKNLEEKRRLQKEIYDLNQKLKTNS